MRNEHDYYVILQVDPQAEEEVIEAAYRRLAVKYHPDHDASPDANSRMKSLNAAYEVLSNAEKRRDYDLHRGNFADRHWRMPQAGRRKGRPWWLLAVTLGIAAVTLLSRSPTLLLFLLVLLFLFFLLRSLGRSERG